MSLTQRFTTFFLAALAIVLVGYTAALYQLARVHLQRQIDERLDSALATLSAAVEIKPNTVEWEPAERKLTIGIDPADDQPRWIVREDSGRLVARSENLAGDGSQDVIAGLASRDFDVSIEPIRRSFSEDDRGRWRMKVVRIQYANAPLEQQTIPGIPGQHYSSLVIAVGLPTRFVDRTLGTLLIWSAGLSAGFWVAAALFGRWLGRRAIRPVTRMADAVRTISVTDLGRRVALPGTKDELEDLAHAFNGLLERVEEAFVRQKQFTAEASHQLRTPLTALLGQADVALRRERTTDEYRETLNRVVRQAQALVRIVEALLFLARADADQKLPGGVPICLGSFVREQVTRWYDHARAADLSASILDGSARIFAPPELLAQILDNLIDNAIKYSASGESIVIRVKSAATVTVEVEDHGIGMTEDDRIHLFQPFFRSAEVLKRGIPGVGLGLSVVKRLVDALGGTLTVTSQPNIGSTLAVNFGKHHEESNTNPRIVESCPA